ncbi:Predicted acetyltransferase, GNAT superfamily [Terriglobus roseus]|uniref:Predicted acetyltransferase, GNAT superfamily n=2 Tax=Terriglobus roseus TaxID=392734 RepID=A0A1H4TNH7_9BACT|nr:Predicted acetyltransferase, GNAT superfamily [Terriglobus roseus]
MSELRIARLTTQEEFEACVDLQQQTWQYSAGEILPRRVFFLAEKLGGHALGAYDGDKLVGFNLGLPAQRRGMGYIHSQMLAVLPEYRNSGLGRRMKLAQRELAIEQGIQVIEWTYDPLEIKNAFFNLSRLGAISRRYVPNFYGASSSPLQGGLPTDRLYAEWWVKSAHAERVMARQPFTERVLERLSVPAQIYAWKAEGDRRAQKTQTVLRGRLQQYFADGLCIIGYDREADGAGLFLLGEVPAELELRKT